VGKIPTSQASLALPGHLPSSESMFFIDQI